MRLSAALAVLLGAGAHARLFGRRETQEVDHLDVHFVVDMSASIVQADPLCLQESGIRCWDLAADSVGAMARELLADAGGWAADGAATGMRMTVTAFSCTHSVGEPITEKVTGDNMVNTESALVGAMYIMKNTITPFGGTCPSEALEMAEAHIVASKDARPNQMVVLLTDGLINEIDLPRARENVDQLQESGSAVYVVAVGKNSGWTQAKVEEDLGPGVQLVAASSFGSIASQVPELAAGVPQPGDDGAKTPDGLDAGADGDPVDVGLIVGVMVGALAGAAILAVVARKRRKDYA